MNYLSRKEELLLLAILALEDNAYGVTIRRQVVDTTGKRWSVGAIYDVLDRLHRKGLVAISDSRPVPERGGKSKRMFSVTGKGLAALREIRRIQSAMWDGLPLSLLNPEES